ncbi:hypothetical protein ES332_A01G105500v1 [Gossypium tomentosum]|uniref:Uncharacterized protein n=1 Tax=Gossypium tomentosum TaxID=34277 RepID=A0A5D2RPY9_GOSTO|nr:hypothetical protein ES332_A01G105500v1 [Gossypium tomentosum]
MKMKTRKVKDNGSSSNWLSMSLICQHCDTKKTLN